MIVNRFDHQKSDHVDVRPKEDREFVQVWNSPRGTPGRRLVLTYFRTAEGPREICHHLHLDEGPFKLIVATDWGRVFYYREGWETRHERFLPSGKLLICDARHGYKLRSVFTADFDWTQCLSRGKPLGDRQTLRRQSEGAAWYVATYQQTPQAPETLRLVEEHRGRELVRAIEVGPP